MVGSRLRLLADCHPLLGAIEMSSDLPERYRETLEFAAAFLSDSETRNGLTEIIGRTFGLS